MDNNGKEYRLNFELVPDSVWGSNLRTLLGPSVWDKLRKIAYEKSGGKCTICGACGVRLEAHERWSYDEENAVQKLVGIVAVCRDCHSVIHIGYTQLKGDEQRAIAHFIKVNGCGYSDYIKALGKANADHRRRNQVAEWKLDLSFLEEFLK